jgi:uncharacterized membrane protein (UPF0127 family)/multidrug transporter EmrE-like cation transporter
MNFLSINYIIWLVLSALSFAVGEFLSKKFALDPKISYILLILTAYCIGTLFWLPAILQKNQLSIVGTMWSVMSLLATVLIGVVIFKEHLSRTIIIGIVLAFLAIVFLSVEQPENKQNNSGNVCINDKCFSVEIAQTSTKIERGLMYRTQLDSDKGMLFIFEKEDVYPFWMKNTLIPLDIIWISQDKKIVFMGENVQPCKTFVCPQTDPGVAAKYVLEINAGVAKQADFAVGDEVKISL